MFFQNSLELCRHLLLSLCTAPSRCICTILAS
jgi:hypothetical protein